MTDRADLPDMRWDDHRPIDRGSDDGMDRVAHLFTVMVEVPPGWW